MAMAEAAGDFWPWRETTYLGILEHLNMYYMKEKESLRRTKCTSRHEIALVIVTKNMPFCKKEQLQSQLSG